MEMFFYLLNSELQFCDWRVIENKLWGIIPCNLSISRVVCLVLMTFP